MHKPYHFIFGLACSGLLDSLWSNNVPASIGAGVAVVVWGWVAYAFEK